MPYKHSYRKISPYNTIRKKLTGYYWIAMQTGQQRWTITISFNLENALSSSVLTDLMVVMSKKLVFLFVS